MDGYVPSHRALDAEEKSRAAHYAVKEMVMKVADIEARISLANTSRDHVSRQRLLRERQAAVLLVAGARKKANDLLMATQRIQADEVAGIRRPMPPLPPAVVPPPPATPVRHSRIHDDEVRLLVGRVRDTDLRALARLDAATRLLNIIFDRQGRPL